MIRRGYFAWVLAGLLIGAMRIDSSPLSRQAERKRNAVDFADKRVSEKFEAFEKQQDAARVYEALEIVEAAGRDVPARDVAARKEAFSRWLHFFAELDRSIDPHWDPKDVPVKGATPPPGHGVVFPSGEVDPATIPDPVARAKYIEALKASKDYAGRYNLQLQLRRIDERAMRSLEGLIRERYTKSEGDRQEFEELLAASRVSESRKERLQALAAKQQ
jgi:hypothetical protein